MRSISGKVTRWQSGKVARNSHGFTLIELLVVMVVIAILAGLMFTNLAGIRGRARDAQRKSDFDQVKKALLLYFGDFQVYPAHDGSNRMMGCGANGNQACNWGEEFSANGVVYMKRLPLDPLNTGFFNYRYWQEAGGDGFRMVAFLENDGDTDSGKSEARCGLGELGGRNRYVVCAD